jgi:hypothetical protein
MKKALPHGDRYAHLPQDLTKPEPPRRSKPIVNELRHSYTPSMREVHRDEVREHDILRALWDSKDYLFQILRAEPGVWGQRPVVVIASSYTLIGEGSTNNGIFVLTDSTYELMYRPTQAPEPESIEVKAWVVQEMKGLAAPPKLLGDGAAVVADYEEP